MPPTYRQSRESLRVREHRRPRPIFLVSQTELSIRVAPPAPPRAIVTPSTGVGATKRCGLPVVLLVNRRKAGSIGCSFASSQCAVGIASPAVERVVSGDRAERFSRRRRNLSKTQLRIDQGRYGARSSIAQSELPRSVAAPAPETVVDGQHAGGANSERQESVLLCRHTLAKQARFAFVARASGPTGARKRARAAATSTSRVVRPLLQRQHSNRLTSEQACDAKPSQADLS